MNDKGLKLKGEALVSFLDGYDATIIGLEKMTKQVLSQLKSLKVISKYGVGIDMIDLNAVRENNIILKWTPGTNSRSVSELVLAMSLNLLRNTFSQNKDIIQGEWRQKIGRELTGLNFGIIGLGNIGYDLVKLLKPFNCKIFYNDLEKNKKNFDENAKFVDLEEIFTTCDIISLHIPLNSRTKNLIDITYLSIMKKNAILINTSRGGIVSETDLYKVLKNNKFLTAGFDVLLNEPPDNFDLINLPNFFITPHIGSSTTQAINNMGLAAIKGLEDCI